MPVCVAAMPFSRGILAKGFCRRKIYLVHCMMISEVSKDACPLLALSMSRTYKARGCQAAKYKQKTVGRNHERRRS